MGRFLGLVAIFLLTLSVRTRYGLLKRAGRIDPKSRALFVSSKFTIVLVWGAMAAQNWST